MQVSITQENLHKALSMVARVVGGRSTLPVLSNVLFKTESNRLKLAATNLEIGVTCWIGAKVESDGEITIPAKLLSEYVASLPSGNIDIKVAKSNISITAENFESRINGIDADEFPSIPEVSEGVKITIPAEEFRRSLTQVVNVASSDDSRPVLTGVYLHVRDGYLYAVATDSYRLAEKRVVELKEEFKGVIVPARTISELLRMVDDEAIEQVEATIDENQVCFKFGEIELVSRLVDGDFPNYRQLIPEDIPTKATVEAKQLKNITKITSLFARDNAGSITLSVEEDYLNMRSIASQVGENNSKIEAQTQGDPIEISLNGRYISEALSVIDASKVEVGLTGKINPCLITPVGDDSYLHLVMPLRS